MIETETEKAEENIPETLVITEQELTQEEIPDVAELPSTNMEQLYESIQKLSAEVQTLRQDFSKLEDGFDSKIKYDTGKEKIINSLHRELQGYRDGLHFKILRPVFLDLIGMYDDFDNLLKHVSEDETSSETEAKLRRNLSSFQGTIEDILFRYGVEIYQEEGNSYVSQRQRSIGVVETDESELDKSVAAKVRPGFAYEGKILRPELVRTFRYQPVQSEGE